MVNIPAPQDLQASRDAAATRLADAAISAIVDRMMSETSTSTTLTIMISVDPYARNLVRKRFREAGWDIKYESCQRDGDWITLTPL